MEETGYLHSARKDMDVAVIGNHIPRQCGLATFTGDIAKWVAHALGPASDVFVVAINDRPEGYDYPPIVRFEVLAGNSRDYPGAADYLNLSKVDLVCLQHEFGIFGGVMGVYVVDLLRDLRRPVVTVAHTVLPEPAPERREALKRVAEFSDALVVLSHKSMEFIQRYYGIPGEKVHMIHHGVPDMPFTDPDQHKARWGLEGNTVLLTFGLLHPGKGIEYMIEAMPRIVERFPETVFVVLGATHPSVKKRGGEEYRFFLKGKAQELGIEHNVVFYDRFVSLEELTDFLAACDIYVTPYLDRDQVVSGTLAYAIGLGKPVVSTPYYYAEELLAEGRGVLVDFCDPQGLARGVLALLENPESLEEMRRNAYSFGRKMIWKEVAREYVGLFRKVLAGREPQLAAAVLHPTAISLRDLPKLRLDYLARLTDRTGVIRGSHFDIPSWGSGYSTADNSLALGAAVLCHLQTDDSTSLELSRTYLGFLHYMQLPDGRFPDLLNYDRTFAGVVGGEECQGKALSGLGLTVALAQDEGLVAFAKSMFDKAVRGVDLSWPRAVAYGICGCYHYLTRFKGAGDIRSYLEGMAKSLLEAYERESSPGWRWFEDTLYYANGLMPRALLLAYRTTGESSYREVALESLQFLTDTCYIDGVFDLVGDQGWYARGGDRAKFKQLPIEAASLSGAYIDAFVVEHEARYLDLARAAFEWFLGRNILNKPLYDFGSASCADGILSNEIDPNRGAEAIIHWLLALLRVQTVLHLGQGGRERDARAGS